MARKKHLINVHTSTSTTAPSGASLYLGEIAVQHTTDNPALWIKMGDSESSEIYEKFISETEILNLISASSIIVDTELDSASTNPVENRAIYSAIVTDELIIASALNDLNDRKADKSYVDEAISGITIDVDDHLDSGSTNPVENRVITSIFEYYSSITEDNEEVTAAALNDLNERKADKSYVDEAISGVTITVDSELNSASTNPVENRAIYQVIVDDEEVISEALNDLNDRKADISYVEELISGISFDVDDHLDSASTNPVENRVIQNVIYENEQVTAAALNDLNDRKADKSYVDEALSAMTIDVDPELDSASTNPVENRAVHSALTSLYELVDENELVTAAALNDLNDRKADKSYVDEALSSFTITVDEELDSASTNPVENRAITEVLEEMGEVTAAALNDLNDRKADKSYVDSAISGISFDVDDHLDSASTNPVENRAVYAEFAEAEEVTAAALNDLNDRKADKSYVDAALSSITIDVDDHLDSGSTNPVENRVLYGIIKEDEHVIAAAFNDINDRKADKSYVDEAISGVSIDVDAELDSGSTNPVENRAVFAALQYLSGAVEDDEEITAAALNDLNDRKADKSYVDEAISGVSFDIDSELDSASTNPVENRAIYEVIVENEEIVAAAFNDVNDRLNTVDSKISEISGGSASLSLVNELSAVVISLSANMEDDEYVISQAFNDVNDRINELSANTKDVTGADVFLTGYEGIPTGLSGDSLVVAEEDSVNEAFGKVQKQILDASAKTRDSELVIAAALNDLNARVTTLSGDTGNRIDDALDNIDALSAAVITISANTGGGGGEQAVTAVTVTGTGNAVTEATFTNKALTLTKGNVQATISDLTTIRSNAASGMEAYNNVNTLSAATTGINSTLTTVSGAAHSKITALSAATTGINSTLTAHTNNGDIHVTPANKTTWNGKQDAISDLETIRNNASSGATAYSNVNSLSAATTAHTGDNTSHITSAERAAWNNAITGVSAGGTNVTVTNKVAAVPSASSSTFGVVKTGDFLTNTNGSIAVSTGTTNTTVAVGNHTHSNYATQANFTAHTADTTAHVTTSEKSTWNGKQDAISDLSTIRNNASSGATAYTTVTAHTGNTAIHLPTVTASDNGKILRVVNGAWALVDPATIYSGSGTPAQNLGNDGDIYLQTS